MYRLIGLIMVVAICMWTLQGFGSLFGLTPADVAVVESYKIQALDRAAPIYSPLMSKQDILNTEAMAMQALPSASSVAATMDAQIVPSVVSIANKIGQAVQESIPPAP